MDFTVDEIQVPKVSKKVDTSQISEIAIRNKIIALGFESSFKSVCNLKNAL
jgi:hypothetical protein